MWLGHWVHSVFGGPLNTEFGLSFHVTLASRTKGIVVDCIQVWKHPMLLPQGTSQAVVLRCPRDLLWPVECEWSDIRHLWAESFKSQGVSCHVYVPLPEISWKSRLRWGLQKAEFLKDYNEASYGQPTFSMCEKETCLKPQIFWHYLLNPSITSKSDWSIDKQSVGLRHVAIVTRGNH